MIRKFIKDEKGGPGIEFLVVAIILLFMLVAFTEQIRTAYTELVLIITYNKGLDKMQQSGGLTLSIENDIKNYMKSFGLDDTKVTVNGTIAPVEWADDISLEIRYAFTYKEYKLSNIVSLTSESKTTTLVIDGGTSNYYFNNN